MNRYTTSRLIRLFVLIVSIAFIGADLSVSAQNANSSTTMPNDTSMQNMNMNTNTNMNRGGRRRRRGRRRSSSMSMPNTESACGPMQGNTNMADTTPAAMTQVRTGRCDPMAQEQTDLSGTYTGTANYAEGGLSGDATLTISGNDFTITSGSATQEGRVVAVTTCNYTAVTMMFGKPQVSTTTGTQPAPLPAVSLRARKTGSGLTLESVGGEARQFSFSAAAMGGGAKAGRPHVRRSKRPAGEIRVGIKPPTHHAQQSQ